MGFLRSPIDFILDTSITWADFENKLRASLRTEARLGVNKSVVDIGDGNGFTSRCGLITCDWVDAAIDEKLPAKVVIKIPSALPMRTLQDSLSPEQRQFNGDDEMWKEMEESLKEAHNIEVATYEYFKEFDGLSLPRLYYGIPFEVEEQDDGQICLEYVDNSRMMSLSERHSVEQVKQIARAIGKMQACSLNKDVMSPELRGDFYERFYTHRTKAYSGMLKGIFSVDGSVKTKKLMEKIEAILPDYYDTNLPVTIHKQLGVHPVLVNGDLRTENVLLDKDSETLASLIDWQCTHLGVGVEDLHRIALFALTAEDRRASMPMLVEEMYNSLADNLGGAEPPYTLEKLLLISDILFPHCALFCAAGCVSLITNKSFESSATDEVRKERMSIAVEKVTGALEDILELHFKNKIHSNLIKFKMV